MILDPIRQATIKDALATLEDVPDYSHKLSLIRTIAGTEVVKEVITRKEEIDAENASAANLLLTLHPESIAYHERVTQLIKENKRAQASGDGGAVDRVRFASEKLCEAFEEMVQEADRDKFVEWTGDDDVAAWDLRWEYLEFRPPIIRREFLTPYVHADPMNRAQQEVLRTLVPDQEVLTEKMIDQMRKLRDFIRPSCDKAVAARAKNEKKLKKLKRAQDRQNLVEGGDQKATKDARGNRLKVVKGGFEGLK